jgi:hypothetical protein
MSIDMQQPTTTVLQLRVATTTKLDQAQTAKVMLDKSSLNTEAVTGES